MAVPALLFMLSVINAKHIEEGHDLSKNLKSQCHTKIRVGAAMHARHFFGMTTTQDIGDLLA